MSNKNLYASSIIPVLEYKMPMEIQFGVPMVLLLANLTGSQLPAIPLWPITQTVWVVWSYF